MKLKLTVVKIKNKRGGKKKTTKQNDKKEKTSENLKTWTGLKEESPNQSMNIEIFS